MKKCLWAQERNWPVGRVPNMLFIHASLPSPTLVPDTAQGIFPRGCPDTSTQCWKLWDIALWMQASPGLLVSETKKDLGHIKFTDTCAHSVLPWYINESGPSITSQSGEALPAPGGFGNEESYAKLCNWDPHVPLHSLIRDCCSCQSHCQEMTLRNESQGENKAPDHHQINTVDEKLVSKIFCKRLY